MTLGRKGSAAILDTQDTAPALFESETAQVSNKPQAVPSSVLLQADCRGPNFSSACHHLAYSWLCLLLIGQMETIISLNLPQLLSGPHTDGRKDLFTSTMWLSFLLFSVEEIPGAFN